MPIFGVVVVVVLRSKHQKKPSSPPLQGQADEQAYPGTERKEIGTDYYLPINCPPTRSKKGQAVTFAGGPMSIKEIVGSGARTFFFAQVCVCVASPLDNGRRKKEGTPYGYKSVFF